MAIRTSDEAVRASIETDASISLSAFIRRANALTDYVSSEDSASALTAAMLTEIETLLACHYYSLRDPIYVEKQTEKAKGVFQRRDYWDEAAKMDVTGTLGRLKKGKARLGFGWLGLAPSEQTAYTDRD